MGYQEMQSFFSELYRRNVVRAMSLYLAFAWVMIELSHLLDHAMGIPGSAQRYLMIILTIGLIPVYIFSWRYELMDYGLEEEENLPQPKRVHHAMATNLDRATIVLLVAAYFLALVDMFAVEPRSPHRYDSISVETVAADSEARG